MFEIFNSLTKAAVAVVSLPATIVADVVTMGGFLTDKDGTYTGEALSDALTNLHDASKPDSK